MESEPPRRGPHSQTPQLPASYSQAALELTRQTVPSLVMKEMFCVFCLGFNLEPNKDPAGGRRMLPGEPAPCLPSSCSQNLRSGWDCRPGTQPGPSTPTPQGTEHPATWQKPHNMPDSVLGTSSPHPGGLYEYYPNFVGKEMGSNRLCDLKRNRTESSSNVPWAQGSIVAVPAQP